MVSRAEKQGDDTLRKMAGRGLHGKTGVPDTTSEIKFREKVKNWFGTLPLDTKKKLGAVFANNAFGNRRGWSKVFEDLQNSDSEVGRLLGNEERGELIKFVISSSELAKAELGAALENFNKWSSDER